MGAKGTSLSILMYTSVLKIFHNSLSGVFQATSFKPVTLTKEELPIISGKYSELVLFTGNFIPKLSPISLMLEYKKFVASQQQTH